METINRISLTNGSTSYVSANNYRRESTSWTVDRMGFIRIFCDTYHTYTASSSWTIVSIYINDKVVHRVSNGYFTSGDHTISTIQVIPVNKNDVVKIIINTPASVSITVNGISCYYIPPIFIADEQMMNAALINRPDKWIVGQEYNFGDNLYGQRFTGNVSITTNNVGTVINIDSVTGNYILNYGGIMETIYDNNTYTYPIGNIPAINNFNNIYSINPEFYNNTLRIRFNSYSSSHTLRYDLWMKYAK
jgi:hypothetical protein